MCPARSDKNRANIFEFYVKIIFLGWPIQFLTLLMKAIAGINTSYSVLVAVSAAHIQFKDAKRNDIIYLSIIEYLDCFDLFMRTRRHLWTNKTSYQIGIQKCAELNFSVE